jgi:hypothetical protein
VIRSNDVVAERALRYRFTSRVAMLCECDDVSCDRIFLIGLEPYREARAEGVTLTAPGHAVTGAEPDERLEEYWVHRRRVDSGRGLAPA